MANFSQIFFFSMGERHISQEAISAPEPKRDFGKKSVFQRFKGELAAVAGALTLSAGGVAKADASDPFDNGRFERGSMEEMVKGLHEKNKGGLSDEEREEVENRSKDVQSNIEKTTKALEAFYDKKVPYDKCLKMLEDAIPMNSTTEINSVTVERTKDGIFIDFLKVTPKTRAKVAK